jgi:putative two-component system response regulator
MVEDRQTATIMIVDDTPINLRLLESMLKKKGYRTRAFTSGKLAIEAATENPPDLILLDINMPEMNGYEVCQDLKEQDQTRDIPVIFISALNELEDKMTAFTAGGVDYITKPFQFAEVQARVETHLQIRRMQAELRLHNLHLQELVDERVQAILETKRELEHAQHATILAMSKIAETRDANTGRHIERTQQYCYALSMRLRDNPAFTNIIDDNFIENIRRASPLHDIGKVAIPDGILLKMGKLTHDEFEIMKSHTTIGADNLRSVLQQHPNHAFVAMGVVMAQSHHEKWNGQGYPEGLLGDEIPLSAQIMAVADVYDALRTERSYKQALSHEESRDIILAETGTHFSPAVGAAFASIEKDIAHICQHLEDE